MRVHTEVVPAPATARAAAGRGANTGAAARPLIYTFVVLFVRDPEAAARSGDRRPVVRVGTK